MSRGEVIGGGRYPLRRQDLEALRDVVALRGVRQVAQAAGLCVEELDEVMSGRFPTVNGRRSIIQFLVRTGLSKHKGDPFRPDGTEAVLTSRQKSALQTSGSYPNDNEQTRDRVQADHGTAD